MVQNVTLLRCIEHEEVVFCKANFEKSSRTIHYFKMNIRRAKSYMVKYTCLGCFIYGSFRNCINQFALIANRMDNIFMS